MPLLTPTGEDQAARLEQACDWLSVDVPELSGCSFLSRAQWITVAVVCSLVIIATVISPISSAIVLVALATTCYVAIVVNRVLLTARSLRRPNVVWVDDAEARSLAAEDLPVYTVLVPMYKEASMVPQLVANLRALEYPRDRLDVKLLLEADDAPTASAVMAHDIDDFEIIIVPNGGPRTKPKALNYGLTFARGELVTIYDAEDRPDPLQLRKAAVAFRRLPPRIGCLQAKLECWNSSQNLITRWFGAEYLQWFRLVLPGLAATDTPVPLGGTSNHVRRSLLESVGGWDPYNVTEDADLGIRLHRAGCRTAVLDSTTWEEANSDYINWNRQRSRWYKGYLQTWLVHTRRPLVLLEELGWRGLLQFTGSVGGTPVLSLANLVFWALTVMWFVGHFAVIRSVFPAPIYYPALLCFVFGNFILAYLYILSARLANEPSLVWAACLVPLYWLMMGVAALKAVWQLCIERSFWEKTVHGLGTANPSEGVTDLNPRTSSAVPAPYVPLGPPRLARELVAVRRPLGVHLPHWRDLWGRLAGPLEVLGFVLLVCVLYAVGFGGGGQASAVGGESLGQPLARQPSPGATIARLEIPAVDIDDLVVEGTSAGLLARNLGHLPGTALPGDNGDAVIVGHRLGKGRALARLPDVHIGDDVVVRVGGGLARYRVVSASSQGGRALLLAPPWASELTIVTSGSGLEPDSLFVLRASLLSKSGIDFVGVARSTARRVEVPGLDMANALVALLWLGFALLAFQLARLSRRHRASAWAFGALGIFVILAVYEMCAAASQALPVTF